MATQFGLGSDFGIPADETGIILDSVSYSYSQESKPLKSRVGDTVGKVYYDEKAEISLSGYIPTSSAFATTLASTITLVTAIPDFFKGSVGASSIVESVTRTHSNEDYQRIEVMAMHHPLIA